MSWVPITPILRTSIPLNPGYKPRAKLYICKGIFCQRTIGWTIESRDNGLISGWVYNRHFTVYPCILHLIHTKTQLLAMNKTKRYELSNLKIS